MADSQWADAMELLQFAHGREPRARGGRPYKGAQGLNNARRAVIFFHEP